MSPPFPSDATFDRGVGYTALTGSAFEQREAVSGSSIDREPYPCVPVDSSEGAAHPANSPAAPSGDFYCSLDHGYPGFDFETGEEFVLHENAEALAAMVEEGALPSEEELTDEVFGTYDGRRNW